MGSIVVPEPFGLDVSPDGTKLYVATAFGDIYLIDPGVMQVLQRFPSATLGQTGYTPTQALILADGRLALMGAFGGFFFDGSQDWAIWDPATNNLQVIPRDAFGAFGQFAVSGDRTKVLVGGATSQQLMLFDPATGTSIVTGWVGGNIINILPTADGKSFFVLGSVADAVFDADTLAVLRTLQTPCSFTSAALSNDGSTFFCSDQVGNILSYNFTTLAQTGWVPNFNVLDLQSHMVLSAVDETGLVAGPIGHGIAFLDTQQMKAGTQGTDLSIGFLTPGFGPLQGGTAVQANYDVPVGVTETKGTVYIGNGLAGDVSFSPVSITASSPPAASGGVADFTVVLPDGSMDMMPEDFSYGPTIVEVSTNAATAEGGAQGAIFGYGFGQQPSDVQVTIGGQSATITQLLTNASPTFPYPFPMEAVLFNVPPGVVGDSADVVVKNAAGSATATGAFHYAAAVQTYSAVGAFLMQGIYDPFRRVLYFTDTAQIDVFSPAAHNWLAPIMLPNTTASTRLVGISLSPDGNTLAVSDAGANAVYVLNPSSPASPKRFGPVAPLYEPFGVAATNNGTVYIGTSAQGISPSGALSKLTISSGQFVTFPAGPPLEDADEFMRVLLSPDGSRIYANGEGGTVVINTSDDSQREGLQVTLAGNGTEELALSKDGTTILTSWMFTDANLNVNSGIAYVDRDVWLPLAVHGQKLNADGSLAFQPLTTGIDILDGTTGLLRYRLELSVQPANVYDALAVDDADSLVFVITADGIAAVDFSSLPVPALRRQQKVNVAGQELPEQRSSQFSRPVRRGSVADQLARPRLNYSQSPAIR